MPAGIVIGLAELLVVSIAWIVSRGSINRAALYLLCLTAPLEVYRSPVAGYNVSLFRVSLLLVLAVLVVLERQRVFAAARVGSVVAYTAFGVLMATSVATLGDNDFLGRRNLAQLVVGVVALAVVVHLARREEPRVVLGALLLGGLLPLLAACYQGLAALWGASPQLPLVGRLHVAEGLEVTREREIFAGTEGIRLKGTFGDPNHFGTFLALLGVIAIGLSVAAMKRRHAVRAAAFAGLALASVAVVAATYSRTAWLAFLSGVAMLAFGVVRASRGGHLGPITPKALAAAACLVLLLLAPLAPRVASRLDPGTPATEKSNETHARTAHVAFESFLDHPIFGIGQSDLGPKLGQGQRASGAHSSYLTFAAELGVLGLLLIALATTAVLRPAARAVRCHGVGSDHWLWAYTLAAAYFAFLVANITYDVWLDDFHWVVAGAIVGMTAAEIKRTSTPTTPREPRPVVAAS